MPDLSIIVPIYNVEDYLDECLSSIEAAITKRFNFEIICVNDGSTDGSEAIANKFALRDSRFRVINQQNGGYGKAINTGMRASTGRFFTIVESDDVITPNAYPSLLEILDGDPSVDFIKTPYQPFTVDGPKAQLSVPPSRITAKDIISKRTSDTKPVTFTSDRLIFEPPAIWAGVYRLESLKKFGISLPETPGAGYQDTCFSALCFLNGLSYHWVDDRYYMYRVDRETASRHVQNRRSEIIDLFDHIHKGLVSNNNFTDAVKPYYFANFFRRMIWFMQRVRADHRFILFIEAYRKFSEVWECPELRLSTMALLPGHEAKMFDDFWHGKHEKIYVY